MTRAETLRALTLRFRNAGLEEPELEAILLMDAAGIPRLAVIAAPDAAVGAEAGRIEALASRREAGEPLTRILGRREFWSLDFRVTSDVLDPRPDTETIIEAALAEFAHRRADALRVVDFGIGSGAILAAILTEFPKATGVGVDRSAAAAAIASANLVALGLSGRASVVLGDWGGALSGTFDLIVSNPPYIPSGEIATLSREVRDHDPRLALDGGEDGLQAYRALAPEIAQLLAPGGRAVLEFGQGQGDDVSRILAAARLGLVSRRADLNGIERVIVASPPAAST